MFQRVGKIFFIITTMIVLILGTTQWMRGKNAFSLKNVKIKGTKLLNRNELLQQAHIEYERDIFDLEVQQIEDCLKQNPMIKNVNVVRQIPSTIKIEVKERELVGILFVRSKMFGLDESGCVVTNIDPHLGYDLPIISGIDAGNDAITIQQKISEKMPQLGPLLNYVKKVDPLLFHRISEIAYHSKTGCVMYLRTMTIPVILGMGDFKSKIQRLSFSLPQIEKDFAWKDVAYINLSFDSQVVVKRK